MIPKSDRNSQGSSKESRSLFVSAGRRMVGCHPMANGHGSNEPETTRTEPKGTDANRRTCKPTRGNDGGRLAGAAENRRNSNETHPEKRNSRMTDAPGGEPGSVILANSRRRSDFAITPPRSCRPCARWPRPWPHLRDVGVPRRRSALRSRQWPGPSCLRIVPYRS